ncbi:MAG TPA: MgtC/SapB family protein [Gemmatimonadaceae bacterium]|uniref:Magnesium transporter, putative Mg2+ transporter-C (MgtC) family protein n=1 Tax=uncultured Gemmatimonadetes bacterium Rifle_16ft_4_minimus_37772 TaxID=1665097 RepID=A0A0H4TPU5_9BACT|nr:magnesium transporter, putative Mg2+ transporter-C (MgtC) family protein [uncultured Gemmatimonadetes bacterium Rifle_16ft_4_minimus_37772]HLA90107.1 MgtC/SapB family protein [Gemmatimonadaceae bacterium]
MAWLAPQLPSIPEMFEALRLDLAVKLGLAVLAGGAIGFERQIAGKPAGLRTNILICVGSALLMDLSISVGMIDGGPRIGDPGRIAAQVITGIGFIGAGTIMQSRSGITGLTSAATIWVVAAIGLTVGAGLFLEAMGATAAVMLVLAGLGTLEHRLLRARRSLAATVRTRPGTTLEWLKTMLFADGLTIVKVEVFDHDDDRVFEMRVKGPSRQFDIARASLLEREEVLNVIFD